MAKHRIGSSERPDWPLAVIVGAGGMGTAIARRLGQSHRLLIADRNDAHGTALADRLRGGGHDADFIACDVTEPQDVDRLAERAQNVGSLRSLACVVGLSPSMGDFDTIMAVNLVAAARIASAFAEVLVPGGCGLFISSSSAHMSPVPAETLTVLSDPLDPAFLERIKAQCDGSPATAYALSKAGLIELCRRECVIWGQRGNRIVSLSPGLIATPMGAAEFERSPRKHDLLAATPIGREGTMLEIAGVAAFLLSDAASYISGTDILVDGGLIGALKTRGPMIGAGSERQ